MKDVITLIMESYCDVLKAAASYDEWAAMGCHVIKGQKSLRRRTSGDGKPLFEIWQTLPKQTYEYLLAVDALQQKWRYLEGGIYEEDAMEILDEEQYH